MEMLKYQTGSFFEKMVRWLCKHIHSKRDGVFQIDTRLRPYGDAGPLAVRLDNFIQYYDKTGGAHSVERLALCRMRPVAGTPQLAERILSIRDELLYALHSIDRQAVFDFRKKQLQSKVKTNTRNAKFSLGALSDVEYNIQMLQVEYGNRYEQLRQPHVHNAIMVFTGNRGNFK